MCHPVPYHLVRGAKFFEQLLDRTRWPEFIRAGYDEGVRAPKSLPGTEELAGDGDGGGVEPILLSPRSPGCPCAFSRRKARRALPVDERPAPLGQPGGDASRTRCTSVRNTRRSAPRVASGSPVSTSASATASSVDTYSRLGSGRSRP